MTSVNDVACARDMKNLAIVLVVMCLAIRAEAQVSTAVADKGLAIAPLNTKPVPEYQSAARLYQGVPSLARDSKSGRLWATWFTGGRDESKDNYCRGRDQRRRRRHLD